MSRRRTLLLRWSLVSAATAAAAVVLALRAATPESRPVVAGDRSVEGLTDIQLRGLPADLPRIRLRESGRAAGLTRAPYDGKRSRALPEDMGTGAALADFDGDGDLDLLLAGSGPLGIGGPCLLYRNEGGLRFTDVSSASLPPVRLLGMGVAAADADGDGDIDAFVSGYGDSLFLRNRGDGTFEDGTDAAGLRDRGFGAGAVFSDLDGDGRLDLYLCRYVEYRDDDSLRASASRQYGLQIPAALNPSTFPPQENRCFRNRGDGTFEEVARAWGVADAPGRSLGAAAADLDGDGRPEIYVANDLSDNALFHNLGGGRFEDVSHASCTADYRGAMGLATEDLDGDGWPEILVTHWLAQEDALYHNLSGLPAKPGEGPRLFFTDAAEPWGLGSTSLDSVKWGAFFSDLDGDGRSDLLVVCGSTFEERGDSSRLHAEPPLLYWNAGKDRGFFECARTAGGDFARPRVARGLAAGDLDGDGDEDFVVTVHGEPPLLLVNETASAPRLVVRLRAKGADRSGLGARVAVTAGGRTRTCWVGATPSYLCTSSTDLVFGLGPGGRAEKVEARFPSGTCAVSNKSSGLLIVNEP